MITHCRQRGMYSVEFALVGAVFLFILFACFEVARLAFTFGALDAVTQRGARVAAICAPNNATVAQVAIFENGGSSLIPGLSSANINVQYLDETQTVTGAVEDMAFVRVSIVNYTHQMLIPDVLTSFVSPSLLSPTFETTLPSESLGWDPDNAIRNCF